MPKIPQHPACRFWRRGITRKKTSAGTVAVGARHVRTAAPACRQCTRHRKSQRRPRSRRGSVRTPRRNWRQWPCSPSTSARPRAPLSQSQSASRRMHPCPHTRTAAPCSRTCSGTWSQTGGARSSTTRGAARARGADPLVPCARGRPRGIARKPTNCMVAPAACVASRGSGGGRCHGSRLDVTPARGAGLCSSCSSSRMARTGQQTELPRPEEGPVHPSSGPGRGHAS